MRMLVSTELMHSCVWTTILCFKRQGRCVQCSNCRYVLLYFSAIMKHVANDEKLNLNLRLSLVSSVSWVSVPDHLVLMNTGLFKLL